MNKCIANYLSDQFTHQILLSPYYYILLHILIISSVIYITIFTLKIYINSNIKDTIKHNNRIITG